jgi:hypothetical protein
LDRFIVHGLRRRHPAIEFQAAQLDFLRDELILELAAAEDAILVTHDRRTMPPIFSRWIRDHFSPGVFVSPQGWAIAEAIDQLELVWSASDPAEWHNRIIYLPTLSDFR